MVAVLGCFFVCKSLTKFALYILLRLFQNSVLDFSFGVYQNPTKTKLLEECISLNVALFFVCSALMWLMLTSTFLGPLTLKWGSQYWSCPPLTKWWVCAHHACTRGDATCVPTRVYEKEWSVLSLVHNAHKSLTRRASTCLNMPRSSLCKR